MGSTEINQRVGGDDFALDSMTSDGTAAAPKSAAMETFNLFYTFSRTNVTFHRGDASSSAEYYFETKLTTIRKPQLYLRKGAKKTSPTIGVGKIQLTSRHTLVALGDYENRPEEASWNELHREKNAFRCSDYFLSIDDKKDPQANFNLQWRKDHSKLFATVYDCVDAHGTVVARLRSGGGFNWKKGGEVDVVSTMGETLKEWLLLSAMGIWTWEALDYQSLLRGYEKDSDKDKQEQKVQ